MYSLDILCPLGVCGNINCHSFSNHTNILTEEAPIFVSEQPLVTFTVNLLRTRSQFPHVFSMDLSHKAFIVLVDIHHITTGQIKKLQDYPRVFMSLSVKCISLYTVYHTLYTISMLIFLLQMYMLEVCT